MTQAEDALWHVVIRHPMVEPSDLDRPDAHGVALGSRFDGTSRENVARRLAIYAQAYVMRITGVLEQGFPATAAVMGSEHFGECCWRYLRQHPSAEANVRWVGRHFVEFLSGREVGERFDLLQRPWLVELAAFEWARGLAFDAEVCPLLTVASLTSTPLNDWPSLRLAACPSLHALHFAHDVTSVWEAAGRGQSSEAPLAQPQHLVVWRQGHGVRVERVEPAEGTALGWLAQGASLSRFCERVAADQADGVQAARKALSYLQRWAARGWLRQPDSAPPATE